MNKETFMEYLKKNKYYIYNNWLDYIDEIIDKIDLLIAYYQKEIETEKAKLEAKCYAYEKVIANSNFKAIIDKEDLRRRKNENKQLKEKINDYENPDDMTLMFMWCDEKAKDKIKNLQQALLDIKELINKQLLSNTNLTKYTDEMCLKDLKDIVNKALGDKENE